ncbi:hypothetical protein K438DRAFT_1777141 [Mycena galopus ATCC 62051]|nr:hypothetical protein K438DRAFT_1777141 [Mycena galopus ATCC 62051]
MASNLPADTPWGNSVDRTLVGHQEADKYLPEPRPHHRMPPSPCHDSPPSNHLLAPSPSNDFTTQTRRHSDTGLFVSEPPKDAPLSQTLVWPANIISVAITFHQIALFDLFTALGVKADVIVGHSIGETAVLYASGAMSRDMTVKIAIARGRALGLIDNIGGTMVAISGCDSATVQSYIEADFALTNIQTTEDQQLYIASLNSPTDVGVSGFTPLVEELTNYISNFSGGATATKLRVSTAVHSPLVDACEAVYRAELEICFSQYTGPFMPKTLVMSSVTGEFKHDPFTVDYLWQNLRRPVQFATAIPAIVARFGEKTTFLEMAPHPVLTQYIKRMGAHDSLPASMRPPTARQLRSGVKPSTEVDVLLETLGNLLLGGINSINFAVLNGCVPGILKGPAYPMDGKVWPFAQPEVGYLRRLLPPRPPLNSTRLRVSPSISGEWMGDHVVDKSNIVPAAAYLEMALEFGNVMHLWDCHFSAACAVAPDAPAVTLEVSKEGINWTVKSSEDLRRAEDDIQWTESGPKFNTVHVYGKLGYGTPRIGPKNLRKVDVDAVLERCFAAFGHDDFYSEIETVSQFGESFSRIEKIHLNSDETLCWIRADIDQVDRADYIFYPPLMDAVFQVGMSWNLLHEKINIEGTNQTLCLPHSLRRAFRNDGSVGSVVLPSALRCYGRLVEWSLDHHIVDLYVLDEDAAVLFTFEGFRFNFLSNAGNQLPIERYMVHWQPRSIPATSYEAVSFDPTIANFEEVLDVLDYLAEELLAVLDYFAMKYSAATVDALPPDFNPETSDRKRYLEWAKKQALMLPTASIPPISAGIMEKNPESSTAAVEALFRDDIMSKVYELPPFVCGVFDQAVEMFVQLVQDAGVAGKRVVRVLEIGAGTGRFTALLGKALLSATGIGYVDFVATDISISLAQEACVKSPWHTMTSKTLDLRIPVNEQGFDRSTLLSDSTSSTLSPICARRSILSTRCSCQAVTSAPLISMARLSESMIPPGLPVCKPSLEQFEILIIIPGMDFVFGSFSEWFGVLEERSDTRHCTLTIPQWKETLHASGFSDTLFITGADTIISHLAFVSQSQSLLHVKSMATTDDLTLTRHFEAGDEVALVQFIKGRDSTRPYTLWLHTDTRTKNSRLTGIVRSLRREFSVWTVKLVLFEFPWAGAQQAKYIAEHLFSFPWIDAEILVDIEGCIRVPRVVAAAPPPIVQTRDSHSIELDDSRVWRSYPSPLNPCEIEVQTAFLGVSPIFPGFCEFSGTVTALGSCVIDTNLLGQSVVGVTRAPLGTTVVCKEAQVVPPPDGPSPDSAASLTGGLVLASPVVTPALSGLPERALILLHFGSTSAAALATHRYLKHQGFESVMITATNPSSSYVYDARQHDIWSAHAREEFIAGAEGVDLVFNFDSDPDVAGESIQLLCGNGTFVQVGANPRTRFTSGHHYFFVDADTIYRGLSVKCALKSLGSLPIPAANKIDILYLQAETGRISSPTPNQVLDMTSLDESLTIYRGGIIDGTSTFNPRAMYVLIGGIGGLGIALARCLVENGARHVVLTSRNGQAALRNQPGVTVDAVALDCLDANGTKALFSKYSPDVAGVFYLPLVLNDQMFGNLDSAAQWKPVLDVKTKGLQILLDAVDVKSLDFLLLTSSIVTVTGSDGQANYAAAQKHMEAIGDQIPNAVSVIAPITDSGAFVRGIPRGQGRNIMLEKYKKLGMGVHQLAEHCVDAIRMLEVIPTYNHSFMRHLLVKETVNPTAGTGMKERSIRRTCATVLSMDIDAVQENIPLSTYGLDSLTSVRLSGILKAQFGIQVSQLQLLSNYMSGTVKRVPAVYG